MKTTFNMIVACVLTLTANSQSFEVVGKGKGGVVAYTMEQIAIERKSDEALFVSAIAWGTDNGAIETLQIEFTRVSNKRSGDTAFILINGKIVSNEFRYFEESLKDGFKESYRFMLDAGTMRALGKAKKVQIVIGLDAITYPAKLRVVFTDMLAYSQAHD